MNVLIDPNWSMWLSVIKRLKRPGFQIDHLPSIDLVLVTHAHFDHLNRRSLRRVAADQPIVVPTGVGNLVHDLGFNIVHELEQWEQVETRAAQDFADALSSLGRADSWPISIVALEGLLSRATSVRFFTAATVPIFPVLGKSESDFRSRSRSSRSAPTTRRANVKST